MRHKICDNTPIRVKLMDAFQRFMNRRWMMPVIVHKEDAVRFAEYLAAPFCAFK